MVLFDLIQYVLSAEVLVCGEANDFCIDCVEEFRSCPATAFTSIAAAYATGGYWVQADLLDMLTVSKFAAVAPLLYVVAVIGGLVGVAIGQPPRVYMWFFLGPALYGWLIDTRQPATGVQWQVGQWQQDQKEVWKQAEVLLINTNMARRMEEWNGFTGISSRASPEDVEVANFFLWFDSTISSVVNALVDWAGPYRLATNDFGLETNIAGQAWLSGLDPESETRDRWFLLSNLKWTMLENITSAKLTDPMVRDAFATFMGGLCGEQLAKVVDPTAFQQAAKARGHELPWTVFKQNNEAISIGGSSSINMAALAQELRRFELPWAASPLRRLFQSSSSGNFRAAFGPGFGPDEYWFTGQIDDFGNPLPGSEEQVSETMRCDTFLFLLMLAFRWEAGHIYAQMMASAPNIGPDADYDVDEKAKSVVYNLFYGWDIRNVDPVMLRSAFSDEEREELLAMSPQLTIDEAQEFLMNLILVHLIKNEFALVIQPTEVRYTGTQLAINYVEGNMRTVGQKAKFGELYSWAILMPYLQGILLYYLAMGYPFACLLMIIPGWHKSLFTWMSFWAWVKIWDVGFALVMSIERSVWAMIGNSAQAASLYGYVVEMKEWGKATAGTPTMCDAVTGCSAWDVQLFDQSFDYITMLKNFRILDRAMTVGPSLDIDLANAYYIYIMAALYLAVPAVTGQLVLGARAGASSLVTGALGSVTGEAGKAAASGYTGDATQRLKSNASSMGQAAMAAEYQKSGLAAQALEMGNQQTMSQVGASYADASSRGVGQKLQTGQIARDAVQSHAGMIRAQFSAGEGSTSAGISGFARAAHTVSQARRGQAGPGVGGIAAGAGAAADIVAPLLSASYGQANAGMARVENAAMQDYLKQSGAANIAQAGYNVDSFRGGSMAQGYGRGAGLKQAEAQFGAEMGRWNTMNRFANQLGGASAAMGVFAGTLDPGQKPMSMEGLAVSGMAGGRAREAATQFDPFRGGGLLGSINSMGNQLNSSYGSGAIASASYMPGFHNVLGYADKLHPGMGWSRFGTEVAKQITDLDNAKVPGGNATGSSVIRGMSLGAGGSPAMREMGAR